MKIGVVILLIMNFGLSRSQQDTVTASGNAIGMSAGLSMLGSVGYSGQLSYTYRWSKTQLTGEFNIIREDYVDQPEINLKGFLAKINTIGARYGYYIQTHKFTYTVELGGFVGRGTPASINEFNNDNGLTSSLYVDRTRYNESRIYGGKGIVGINYLLIRGLSIRLSGSYLYYEFSWLEGQPRDYSDTGMSVILSLGINYNL